MKKLYFFLFLIFSCISGITMAQTFNWQEQVLTERSENMQNMGVADDGSATIVGYGNSFYRSTDQGDTWVESPIFYDADEFDYGTISFYGNLGFAGGSSFFKVVDRRTSRDIYANNALLKTTDGGETWVLVTVDNIGAGEADSISLAAVGNYGNQYNVVKVINDTVVYLSANWYDVYGDRHGTIYKSTDAGETWKSVLPDNGASSIASITDFKGSIYVAGYKTLYKVNIETDEVTDLYPILVAQNKDDNMFFVKTTIYNDNELIFPTYSDSIWVTSDEGASFKTLTPNLEKGYYVYKYDENHIVVAGGKSDTKATSDGGATWTLISVDESIWNCVVSEDSLIGLATGDIYSMAITDIAAGNFTWNYKDMEGTDGIIKGADTTNNNIFIASNGDYICKSSDGGSTYTEVTLPAKTDMVYASAQLDFMAYGQGTGGNAIATSRYYKLADFPSSDSRVDYYLPGVILVTDDNWETSFVIDDTKIGEAYGDDPSLNPFAPGCFNQDFFSAECVDKDVMYVFVSWADTTGVAYADRTSYSRVFKTSNASYAKDNKGAALWDTITPNLGSTFIRAINFEGDTGYITGNKTIYKTTDGGATLTSLVEKLTDLGATSPYVQNALFFGDTLYVATTGDSIFVSYDAGESFSVIPGVKGASDFVVVDANSWMTVGGSNACFYTNDAGTTWDGCYPGYSVYRAGGIYADNVIALSKSKIYKIAVSDLDPATGIRERMADADNGINLIQYTTEISITSDKDITQCEMYNISGQKMFAVRPSAKTYSFNTTSFKNGIYIVRVVSNNKFETYKVLLKD